MMYRKLRIAWSIWWGVACLLLVVLWVRSYLVEDYVAPRWFYSWRIQVTTAPGGLIVFAPDRVEEPSNIFWGWMSDWVEPGQDEEVATPKVLGFRFPKYESYVQVPFWFMFAVTALAAGAAWLPWRFSLRTLLIVMTLTAVGLGWILYGLR